MCPNTIRISDTTLRDGAQTPEVHVGIAEKVQIAQALEAVGVDVIEAGFPASSPGDAQAVRAVAEVVKQAEVMALSRCVAEDIRTAAAALAPADRPVLHLVFGVSDVHLIKKLRKSRSEAIAIIDGAVRQAAAQADRVQFSLEDATRADPIFLRQCMQTAVQAGAGWINLADTVGCALPEEFGALIGDAVRFLEGRAGVSAHCHNDLGLATANSIAAIRAGAGQIEAAVNGLGERAGNTALEEVAVVLHAKAIANTRIRLNRLTALSEEVAQAYGVVVQPNRAIVGKNAFRHASGIHQDGLLKDPSTYAFIAPELVGAAGHRLVLGAQSGRSALAEAARERGYELSKAQLARIYTAFISKASQFADSPPPQLFEAILEQEVITESASSVTCI